MFFVGPWVGAQCREGSAQISEVSVKVCFVGPPCQSIYSRCGVFLEFEERLTKQIDADVVEERSELLLFPSPCDFPYAFQRLGHACPALRPVRALLVRIPLGPHPLLHRLRSGWPHHRLLRSG